MPRSISTTPWCLGVIVLAAAAPASAKDPADALPLPANAVARFGVRGKADAPVDCLAFAADGSVLVAGGPKGIAAWACKGAGDRPAARAAGPVYALAVSTDGKQLVTAGSNGVGRYRIPGAAISGWFKSAPGAVLETEVAARVLGLAPDGERAFVGDEPQRLTFFDAGTGRVEKRLTLAAPALAAALSLNGRSLGVLTRDGVAAVWSVAAGGSDKDLAVWRKRVPRATRGSISFSPDGAFLACSAVGRVLVLESVTGRQLYALDRAFGDGDVLTLAFSPDGRFLAAGTGGATGVVRVWEVWTGKAVARLEGHDGPVNVVAFAPDGRTLASGSADGTIVLWNASFAPKGEAVAPLDPDAAWEALDSLDIREAYRASASLVGLGERAVPLVRGGLTAARDNQARIRGWIADLDDYSFRVREAARKHLVEQGLRAVPALRAARETNLSPEAARLVALILEAQEQRGFHAPAEGFFGEALRALRAVQVLERVGGERAAAVLAELAKGPADDRLAAEARGALGRLRR